MLAAVSIASIASRMMPVRRFGGLAAVQLDHDAQGDVQRHVAGQERGRRGGPADEADRAVRPQDLAEDDGGQRGAPAQYEATLKATFNGACRRRTAKMKATAQAVREDEQVGGEEDQPDEERHLLQHEGVGVAPVVQRHRQPGREHQSTTDDGEHGRLGDQVPDRPEALEWARQAEEGSERGPGRRE